MHYGSKAFSKNGHPTIQVIENDNVDIGQRNGFSNADLIKINSLYNCHCKYSDCLVITTQCLDLLKFFLV